MTEPPCMMPSTGFSEPRRERRTPPTRRDRHRGVSAAPHTEPPAMASRALICRSVPWSVFPEYYATAGRLLGSHPTVLAREPLPVAPPIPGARIVPYRHSGARLDGDAAAAALRGEGCDVAVIP